jgi:hypothetical protein
MSTWTRALTALLLLAAPRVARGQDAVTPVAPEPAAGEAAPSPVVEEPPVAPLPPPAVLVAPPPALLAALPPPPPPARHVLAPVAGALTAAVPFAVGCALWANNGHVQRQEAGTIVMTTGFALAPVVSHGLAGRWRRAAVFGVISGATSAATLGYMAYKDPFEPGYRNIERVPFGFLLTGALFASAIGVVDSFLGAPELRK